MANLAAAAIPLTAHEALSGILGSISIACWIFLLVRASTAPSRDALIALFTAPPQLSLLCSLASSF